MRFLSILMAMLVAYPAMQTTARDAFVPNQGSDDLTIFDTTDPLDRVTLPLGDQPHEGVATRDARLIFFSNRADNTLSVFDIATRSEIDTDHDPLNGLTRIAVGMSPHGLAVTPDNRYLFVANDGSNDVTIVQIQTLGVIATVSDVGSAPHMIAISPDGSEAWTGNVVGGDVSIIDVARAVAGDPDPRICATPGGSGAQCRIAAGAGTEGLAFTRDGRTVYAANGGSNTVSVIDAAARVLTSTISVPGGPRRVHLRPDGRRAYVSELFGSEIRVLNTATHQLIQ